MRRGTIAFDELRSGIKDIEFLADPDGGEVRIACADTLAGGILAPLSNLLREVSEVVFDLLQSNAFTYDFFELRTRKVDLALAMLWRLADGLRDDLNVEHLFDEELCLAEARAVDGPGDAT